MDAKAVKQITAELQKRYPEVGIKSIEVDENSGKSTFIMDETPKVAKTLAFLKPDVAVTPHIAREKAATITRDSINRSFLDLAGKDPYDSDPKDNIKRANRYYHTEPIVGSAINLLASLASKGFEHDIEDPDIKNFFDSWALDTNFEQVIDWIFLELLKTGNVFTYKAIAKYEPRVSTISATPGQKPKKVNQKKAKGRIGEIEEAFKKELEALLAQAKKEDGFDEKKLAELEKAAKKNIWSKGHLPISYTVLNPELVTVEGSLFFDKISVKLTVPTELSDVLGKDNAELSEEEKEMIKTLPADIKKAAEEGGELLLDSRLVGTIFYRKQPYERYARPRTTRVFDTIDYKKALKEADLSTLDGISNYILKITIGSDEFPVTSQEELEAVAQLFNTPSKSFDVVWNHTLKVEKVVSPEIEAILGKDKYEQVNEDLTGGLAITRALIDGVGDLGAGESALVIKGLTEEINYLRKLVSRWIYKEYRQIAEAVGFDSFPKIRWDEGVLKDTIMYMSTLAQLVDRRMLSYRTALEALGFDYPNELANMETELPLVTKGTFGIVGSPFQQAKAPAGGGSTPANKPAVQPKQNSPKGTPSAGRPKGQPTGKNTKNTNPDKKVKQTIKNPKQSEAGLDIDNIIKNMTPEQYERFLFELAKLRKNN